MPKETLKERLKKRKIKTGKVKQPKTFGEAAKQLKESFVSGRAREKARKEEEKILKKKK